MYFLFLFSIGHWPFDWRICSVWVSCDVLSCSSSIMHMCFISLGRYLGIRNPLKTRSSSKKVTMIKIVIVWLLSMLITSPITVLAMIDPTNIQPTPQVCAINNEMFFIFGSMSAFYVPMVVMVVTYILTVRLLQRKAKFLADKPTRRVPFIRRGRRASHESSDGSNGLTTKNGDVLRSSSSACEKCRCASDTLSSDTKEILHTQRRTSEPHGFVRIRVGRQSEHGQHSRSASTSQQQQLVVPGMVRTVGSNQVANEQKATKVLGIVFFCFVICWTPFFILNILFAIKGPEKFHPYLATTFLWLGYVSSTINPIIYTVFNKTFKRAFWKLLTCKCHFSRHVSLHSTNDLATWAFRSANYTTKSGSPPDLYHESLC